MYKSFLILASCFCLVVNSVTQAQTALPVSLPPSPKRPVTDTYFGKAVVDNYRWLEDMNSEETKAWFKAQGDYTNAILNQIPGRDKLVETFVAYDKLKAARINQIRRRGGRFFYKKTLASETIGKLYYREGKTGKEQRLFDAATYGKGSKYTITGFSPSEDGKLVTLEISQGGAEVSTMHVLNVDTKKLLSDKIDPIWNGGASWSADGRGFFYTRLNSADPKDPKRSIDTKAMYHVVGTDQKTDREVFSRAKYPQSGIKPEEYAAVFFNEDRRYVIAGMFSVDQRMKGLIAPVTELSKSTINWKRLFMPEDSVKNFEIIDDKLFFHSFKGTTKGRVLMTNLDNIDVKTATEILPPGRDKLENIVAGKNYLFAMQSDGINTTIQQYNLKTGQWLPVKLPASGTAWVGPYEPRTDDFYLGVTAWKQPTTLYDYDPTSRKTAISPFHIEAKYPGVADLVVEELEIPGQDGTMVPLSLTYHKNLKRNGSAVCFMTGYGSYGYSATPYFNPMMLALLNRGVVIAETHPRGGSEKGEDWYRAGYKTTKPNTWRDFIASGEYLIKNGYTSAGKLIGEGTSAGGILIGRAITERPDLFAAAISNVGCNNALRMEESANGPVNAAEFGTVKDSVECMALYEMDAFQHVKEGTKYPAVLCVGGMNDPRVVAWQPGKFAAALQAASTSGRPVLMQVNYDNGHFTEDKQVTFRNFANMYAFALWQAGHPEFQPPGVANNK
ncbi:MAG: prolyl oligopeptidase [Spirosoma sp.]|nr:prolyl oligopeptidase [Spirosoma sp.]